MIDRAVLPRIIFTKVTVGSRFASKQELLSLCEVLGELNAGVIERFSAAITPTISGFTTEAASVYGIR